MSKCPFTGLKKECSPDCALWMEVVRCYDEGPDQIIKGCVFILDHDERRNQTQRLAMMQAEAGEMKQVTLFSSMAQVTDDPRALTELAKIIQKNMKALPAPESEKKEDGL